VLAASRRAGGNLYQMLQQEGGVIWYRVTDMSFIAAGALPLPPCVLQDLPEWALTGWALLRVFVPAAHPAAGPGAGAAGSAPVAAPRPGVLQMPGLWQEVQRLEVTVDGDGPAPSLHPDEEGWGQLQHLQDHFALALSAVSGGLFGQC
jgi:hypothetical protein